MEKQSKTIGAFLGRKKREVPSAPKSNNRSVLAVVVVVAIAVLLSVIIGAAVYYYRQYQAVLKGSVIENKSELQSIIATVGEFVALPEGEEPTLATVSDVEKINTQPFFAKAENGDKVLFYTNAAQAILFRPSTGKVINMASVNVTDEQVGGTSPQETAMTSPGETSLVETPVAASEDDVSAVLPVTVTLYNGSTKVGVTNTLEGELKTNFPELTVTVKEKALKNDYIDTLVIDLSGKQADLANALAEDIAGTVGSLPLGETVPTTDILIIVGNK